MAEAQPGDSASLATASLGSDFLVGVSTLWPTAARPVLFDRVDERVAHCVSGNSLSPGDYPIGEAFPSPTMPESPVFFCLVSLPTPRRRMAYTYYAETDEKKQLIAISRRTLDRVLADKRPLNEPELLMLAGLDPAEVSRFAGKYFLLLDDGPLTASGPLRVGGRPSRFGMICACLAADGVKDAIPGLTKAIEQKRFLPADRIRAIPARLAGGAVDRRPRPLAGTRCLAGRADRPVRAAGSAARRRPRSSAPRRRRCCWADTANRLVRLACTRVPIRC